MSTKKQGPCKGLHFCIARNGGELYCEFVHFYLDFTLFGLEQRRDQNYELLSMNLLHIFILLFHIQQLTEQ